MDNSPDPDEPFAVAQSMNEVYKLLLFVRAHTAIPTGDLKLLKTKRMEFIDAHVITALTTLRNKLDKKYQAKVAAMNASEQDLYRKTQEIASRTTLLDIYKAEIKELRSDSRIVLGVENIDEDFGFFEHTLLSRRIRHDARSITKQFEWPIHEVIKKAG